MSITSRLEKIERSMWREPEEERPVYVAILPRKLTKVEWCELAKKMFGTPQDKPRAAPYIATRRIVR